MTTTSEVPGVYDIGIDGRGYMVDTQYLEAFRVQTLDPIRRQADSSSSVGESSLNPEGYWRRSPESFHKGAGQARYDNSDSDPDRFKDSRGVDVWTEGQLSLLKATSEILDLGSDILDIAPAPNSPQQWYVCTSNGKVYDVDLFTETSSEFNTAVTGATDIAYVGSQLFVIESGHLYVVTSSTKTAWITSDPTSFLDVFGVGGRLLTGNSDGNTYDVSSSGLSSLPSAYYSERLRSAVEVDGYIYMTFVLADFARNHYVFKTTIKSDGTGLEAPTIAGSASPGETVRAMFSHTGFLIMSIASPVEGYRLAIPDTAGDLTVGQLFAEDRNQYLYANKARAAASGRFLYLPGGRDNSHATVYRADLSIINDALAPAWALDVETSASSGSEYVFGVATVSGDTCFFVSDGTIHKEQSTYSTGSRYVDFGEVSFGTREPKAFLDPVETAEDGTVSHRLTTPDGSTFTDTNVTATEPSVEWRMTLTPTTSGDDMTVKYPILRALPAPTPLEVATVPVLLHDVIQTRTNQEISVDIEDQLSYLRGLRDDGELIDYQDGNRSVTAQVIGVDWVVSERTLDGDTWMGTAVVRLKLLQ